MMLARGTPYWIALIPFLSIVSILIFIETEMVYFVILSIILVVIFIPIMAFFRDPTRVIGPGVVSPADGVVTSIGQERGSAFISIFMNVHNVHVNRFPSGGQVLSVEHVPGGYVPAFDKDSERNERVIIRFRTENGTWEITQIAGAVARRIIPYVSEGDVLDKGDRFGMIRFGSRVDLSFKVPRGMNIVVKEGDRVRAGSSTLAR